MKPDFNLCDCCKKPVTSKTFFVAADRITDAAGSSDDEGGHVDLCGNCAVEVIKFLCTRNVGAVPDVVTVPDYEMGRKVLLSVAAVMRRKKTN